MKRDTIIYMAHPVAPFDESASNDGAGVVAHFPMALNLANATRWLRCLQERNPNSAIIAPWIGQCHAWPEADADPDLREMAMLRNLMVVERCDGIAMVGGRISRGMRAEMEHATECDLLVFDLTHLGYWAPPKLPIDSAVKLVA